MTTPEAATDPEILTADQAEHKAEAFIQTESPQAIALRLKAEGLAIDTDDQYQQANDQGRQVADALRKAETERKALKAPILEAGRRVDSLFDRLMEPLKAARQAISSAMQRYEEKKEDERRRLEEEQRKRALAEQKRLDNLALANAARAEAAGHVEKAEEVLANVPTVPVPVVAPLTPKVEGSSTRKWWKARLVSHVNGKPLTPEQAVILLAKAVGDGQATPNLLLLNEVAANKLAGALGAEMKVPGLEAYQVGGKTFR